MSVAAVDWSPAVTGAFTIILVLLACAGLICVFDRCVAAPDVGVRERDVEAAVVGGRAKMEHESQQATINFPALCVWLGLSFILVVTSSIYPVWSFLLGIANNPKNTPTVPVVASILLSSVPVFISLVQDASRKRQIAKLESCASYPVTHTKYYQLALTATHSLRPARLNAEYLFPMATLSVVLLLFWFLTNLSPFALEYFNHPSFVFGAAEWIKNPDAMAAWSKSSGAIAIGVTGQSPWLFWNNPTTIAGPSLAGANVIDLIKYQEQTFMLGCIAFIGSYTYIIARLLDRINNNDIYPISFYFYTTRILQGFLLTIVFRHCSAVFDITNVPVLIVLAFVIGWAPDLFVTSLLKKGYEALKVLGSKDDPEKKFLPKSLSLFMLHDMSKEKIDRLGELGIDTAQILAYQNPFSIWPRLSYELGLIVDWIAQAQLYTFAQAEGFRKLRAKVVTNIFDFHSRLSDPHASKEICQAIGVCPSSASGIVGQLEDDHAFSRLKEVREAMRANAPGRLEGGLRQSDLFRYIGQVAGNGLHHQHPA
jgi:hypothetical protein